MTGLSFTLLNLTRVNSVIADLAPVYSPNVMCYPLISMLKVQQESFSDTMALS